MNKKNFHTLLEYNSDKQPNYFIVHIPQASFSIVSCWFKAGSCFDPNGKTGLAHMVEHLYMPKTRQNPDTSQRPEYFEDNGMLYSAFTGKEWTYYYLHQLPEDTEKALKMLLDRLEVFNPKPADIEAEKQVILDEINRWFSGPSSYIHTLANKGTWPKSRLGKETLGTADSVKNIGKKDIYDFWNTYYNNNCPQVLILTPETRSVSKLVEQINNLQNKTTVPCSKATQSFTKPLPYIIDYRDSHHLQIAISFLLDNIDFDEMITIDFINYVLANGSNSQLVQRLRFELHSTYWVNGYSMYFDNTGCLRFVLSAEKALITMSLNAIFEVIEKLKSNEISSSILRPYKKAMKIRVLKKYLHPGSLMRYYSQRFIADFQPTLFLQTYIQAIDALSVSRIQKVASQYLTKDKLNVAIIGSIPDKEVNKILRNYRWKD